MPSTFSMCYPLQAKFLEDFEGISYKIIKLNNSNTEYTLLHLTLF